MLEVVFLDWKPVPSAAILPGYQNYLPVSAANGDPVLRSIGNALGVPVKSFIGGCWYRTDGLFVVRCNFTLEADDEKGAGKNQNQQASISVKAIENATAIVGARIKTEIGHHHVFVEKNVRNFRLSREHNVNTSILIKCAADEEYITLIGNRESPNQATDQLSSLEIGNRDAGGDLVHNDGWISSLPAVTSTNHYQTAVVEIKNRFSSEFDHCFEEKARVQDEYHRYRYLPVFASIAASLLGAGAMLMDRVGEKFGLQGVLSYGIEYRSIDFSTSIILIYALIIVPVILVNLVIFVFRYFFGYADCVDWASYSPGGRVTNIVFKNKLVRKLYLFFSRRHLLQAILLFLIPIAFLVFSCKFLALHYLMYKLVQFGNGILFELSVPSYQYFYDFGDVVSGVVDSWQDILTWTLGGAIIGLIVTYIREIWGKRTTITRNIILTRGILLFGNIFCDICYNVYCQPAPVHPIGPPDKSEPWSGGTAARQADVQGGTEGDAKDDGQRLAEQVRIPKDDRRIQLIARSMDLYHSAIGILDYAIQLEKEKKFRTETLIGFGIFLASSGIYALQYIP